ncbi:MAG: hypothetical protein R3194_09470, partial [Limnobacter sp.]|nr:hypothetical protein [Limnobacter sp.]
TNQTTNPSLVSEDLIQALNQVHSVMVAQLQLVIDENMSSGDLLSESLAKAMADEAMPTEIKNLLLPAFLRLQTRDIMQQQLCGLHKIIQQTQETLAACVGSGSKAEPLQKVSALPEQIYETYVMKQQRDTHKKALGLPVEEDAGQAGVDLDFF